MTEFPPVAIGIITYNRPAEIRQTIDALAKHVTYAGPITVMPADDCSPGRYVQDLMDWWCGMDYTARLGWTMQPISTKQNSGWGANANHLLSAAFNRAQYLLMLEDDYVLRRDLDLSAGVALMETTPDLGMLRYRATAGASVLYRQHEADISRHLPDYREFRGYTQGRATWLELLPASDSLWLYSNGPHLKRVGFHMAYGNYPTGMKLGETEEHYAHIVKDALRTHPGAPKIGVLPEWIPMHWDHIGVSYQHTEFDR